ncbi:hypothetical protein HELRODRAFT_90218, partial [Helobdella robusta]|uniref:EF-hand domain-containing protein n=1 Tax=Helobdella robusta TaxID=6412 RepID=T1G7M4_HELRO
ERNAEYKEAFDLFDQDKDGRITMDELKTVMTSLRLPTTDEQIQQMIDRVDTDGNGTIEFCEFRAMLEEHRKLFGQEEDGDGVKRKEIEDVEKTFKVFDIDGDGLIDSDELKKTMLMLGEEVDDDDVTKMMSAADRNKDGKIDFDGRFARMKK